MSIIRRDIRSLARNQEQLRLEDLGHRCRALIHSPMYRSVHYNVCRRVGTSANDICIEVLQVLDLFHVVKQPDSLKATQWSESR